MEPQNEEGIKKEFAVRRTRQVVAVAAAIVLMIMTALLHRHPGIFGEVAKGTVLKVQVLIILLFVNFTAVNWRCPSCRKHLGSDIGRRSCRNCGVRLR